MSRICFVHVSTELPSTRWFLYPAPHLGASSCTVAELQAGLEPNADIYVVQHDLLAIPFARLRSRHKRIFLWLDDAIWMYPIKTIPGDRIAQLWPSYQLALPLVDGAICPSRLLAQDIGKFAHVPTFYIPNYHDFPSLDACVERDPDLVGWGGSYFHLVSWRDSGAYKCIPKSFHVEIIDHHLVAEMIRPFNEVTLLPCLAFEAYLRRVQTWAFYVLPLAGGYDLRRSWIKVLEAAYCGTPVLPFGVNLATYVECPHEAWSGTGQDWAEDQRITHHLEAWKGVLDG
jgi:hypothetical protein